VDKAKIFGRGTWLQKQSERDHEQKEEAYIGNDQEAA
jgi:hypothetical protein